MTKRTTPLDWSTPVEKCEGSGWIFWCADCYLDILDWCEELRKDSLGSRDFQSAEDIINAYPEPPDIDAANDRWRRFVTAIWKTLDRHEARLRKRAKAHKGGTK